MPVTKNNATVVKFQQLPDCLFRIWVRPDWDASGLTWYPGQFLRLGILDHPSEKNTLRAMTVTGLDDSTFEFFMVAVSNGVTSPRIAALREGDRCCLEPLITGNFHSQNLPVSTDSDLWMMGTGTGVAPYLAMLRHAKQTLSQFRNLILVHSVQQEQHLCSTEWLGSLSKDHLSFQYVPVVTRASSRSGQSLRKRIPALLADNALSQQTEIPITAERSVVLLCGHPVMIKDSCEVLYKRGLVRHRRRQPGNILTERYF